MDKKVISEINEKNMRFRIINSNPQYSKQEEIKHREAVQNELYQVFKKYVSV